jgi:hypothetical protein
VSVGAGPTENVRIGVALFVQKRNEDEAVTSRQQSGNTALSRPTPAPRSHPNVAVSHRSGFIAGRLRKFSLRAELERAGQAEAHGRLVS